MNNQGQAMVLRMFFVTNDLYLLFRQQLPFLWEKLDLYA